MLADQPGIHVVIQWNDADGFILKVDFAVDAWLSCRINHLIFRKVDPGVIIFLFRGVCGPALFVFGAHMY